MKILALSLLRLGDILMHREIAVSLKRQYPGCEVHFWINSQFGSAKDLVPEVDVWHDFPRLDLQRILTARRQNALAAFKVLDQQISDLNAHKYDLILNLTHNFLSVRLMDLLEGKEKRGATLENGRVLPDRNRWQTYFNEAFSIEGASRFHYLEILHRALDLDVSAPPRPQRRSSRTVLLQLLTADPKKNWGLSRFRSLMSKLAAQFPETRFYGLCSPSERDMVLRYFSPEEIVSPNLVLAGEILRQADLLVTGDTSLQHLAAKEGCQLISLFLGSADPVKTSPWQRGALILQGKTPCAPCRHSAPCGQASHLCGENLQVEDVAQVVASALSGGSPSGVSLLQTQWQRGHFVTETEKSLGLVLGRAVWSAYLDEELRKTIPSFSAMALDINSDIRVEEASLDRADAEQRQMVNQAQRIRDCLQGIQSSILVQKGPRQNSESDFQRMQDLVVEFENQFPLDRDFVLQLNWTLVNLRENQFEMLKGLRKAFTEMCELVAIRSGILKELRGEYVGKNKRQHDGQPVGERLGET